MKIKLIITFFIVAVVCISCYIAFNVETKKVFKLDASSLTYNETQVRQTLTESGMNSSSWDEFDAYVSPQQGLRAADLIQSLPGQPKVNFRQYSGYVKVDGRHDRALFYYFVESSKRPSTKPLVLWLNGGPPCSSLIGAMVELGPFRIMNDGATLGVNPYAWNKVANVIFLETPAGVGFSYSNTTSDYDLAGEKLTAQDSYTFLINWFERFPAYKSRDFYIAGEEYAGHYVPQLAKLIIQKNKKATRTGVINLRGIAIGNGIIDGTSQSLGTYDFLYKRAAISKELRDTLKVCFFRQEFGYLGVLNTISCESASKTFNDVLRKMDVDPPSCSISSKVPQSGTNIDPMTFDNCTKQYAEIYFNNPKVHVALHTNGQPWSECSLLIGGWNDEEPTVLLSIKELMASGLRIWLYNGDTDMNAPVEGAEYAINALALPVKTPRYPWYNAPNEIAGYATEYDNLTFVTVEGLKFNGSLVPSYEPAKALTIFSSFLQGKPLPVKL